MNIRQSAQSGILYSAHTKLINKKQPCREIKKKNENPKERQKKAADK